jgi:hypothetical protein
MTAPVRANDGYDKVRSLRHLKDAEFDEYINSLKGAEWHKAFSCCHAVLFLASWIVIGFVEPKNGDLWVYGSFPVFFAVMMSLDFKKFKKLKERAASLAWGGIM